MPYYEKGKYDFALLHVDQQCLLPLLGKTRVFKEIRNQIRDIPIIVINHGTPVYPEMFVDMAARAGYPQTEESGEDWARREMSKLLRGVNAVVVNSYKAKEMWGLGDWSHTIIHGLDPDEWYDLSKEPRIVSFISPAGIGEKYYGRRLFRETRAALKEKFGIELVWIGQDKYCHSWEDYREFLSRSLVYFNPTLGSPMPRSRTEAMMSGCCVVTTKYQDADRFIEDGKNGFLIKNNPEHAAEVLSSLIFDYKRALKVGQEGRKTAIRLFNGKRFRQEWINLVQNVLGREI